MSDAASTSLGTADRRRTILFVLRHLGMVRYYQPTLAVLADRGHRVVIVHSTRRGAAERVYGERLKAACPSIEVVEAPAPASRRWAAFAQEVRLTVDYVRYFDSRFANKPILRHRVEEKFLTPWAQKALQPLQLFGDAGRRTAMRVLRAVESAISINAFATSFVRDVEPDVVLATPLVDFGSSLVDWIRAAQARGIPTGACVASWDNLTNKGHLKVRPDRVFVWNEAQRLEAETFHDIPRDRVVVTGAQLFDHHFTLQPATSREEYCREAGLDPAQPFVLFVGSTTWIAPSELYFVERWIRFLRSSSDPRIATIGVMLRPHPTNARRYLSLDVSQLENVSVWPPPESTISAEYFTAAGQHDLFDAIYHSAVVLGANTSAQIDAAIVGRPVCTIRVPEFKNAHEGTVHFAHLAETDGGLLRVAADLAEHERQLAEILTDDSADRERARRFVHAFVRPHGLDRPAAPILADAIEAAAELQPAPVRPPVAALPLRVALLPLVWLAGRGAPDRTAPAWVRLLRPAVRAWAWGTVLAPALRNPYRRRVAGKVVRAVLRRVHRGRPATERDVTTIAAVDTQEEAP